MSSTADVETVSQVRIATAIYPTTSLMNHSCKPNIISRWVILETNFIHDSFHVCSLFFEYMYSSGRLLAYCRCSIYQSHFSCPRTTLWLFHIQFNVLRSSFHNDMLVVRATRDIPKGEQVYNCYGPHHKKMNTSERQQILKDQYFFTCKCEPCQQREDRSFYQVCLCKKVIMKGKAVARYIMYTRLAWGLVVCACSRLISLHVHLVSETWGSLWEV